MNSEDFREISEELGFTQTWFDLGIVNDSYISKIYKNLIDRNDDNPEHARWEAFSNYIRGHSIGPDELAELYKLATSEIDRPLQSSMLHELMKSRLISDRILHNISNHSNKSVVRKANAILASRNA